MTRQRFFLLTGEEGLREQSGKAHWRADHQALMLTPNQQPRLSQIGRSEALTAWQSARPLVIDSFNAIGELDETSQILQFRTRWDDLPGKVCDQFDQPIALTQGHFTDLQLGGDSRLALGIADPDNDQFGLAILHLGKRWHQILPLPEAPIRVWNEARGESWVVTASQLYHCAGQPLPHPYTRKNDRFEPASINPQPLRIVASQRLPEAVSQPLALCDDGEQLHLLVEREIDGELRQQILSRPLNNSTTEWLNLDLPSGIGYATDIQPLQPGRLALLLPQEASDTEYRNRDAAVLQLSENRNGDLGWQLLPLRYPMLSYERARFVTAEDRQLRYCGTNGPLELHPLAQARFIDSADFNLLQMVDSGTPDTQWHKLTMEACIPKGCRVEISTRCFDNPSERSSTPFLPQHPPLWTPLSSELPFASGWREPKRATQGLFEILLQRPEGRVRELRGRYLQLRLHLSGDGRSSPAIHALRIYQPRLCWQEQFLPQHFHQQELVDPSNREAANGADLRQRLFASLESALTPTEERIAAAECLFDPQIAPRAQLPRLAQLLGIRNYPSHWPEARQRRLIQNAGLLQQRHGSYAGLVLALDIATDGAVARGQIVPIENFRFRRTLSTILGVSLEDSQHPLTLGTSQSGNSVVGDSLILSKSGARQFLALLGPDDLREASDKALVECFFDEHAHRLSILLHGEAKQWQANIEQVLAEQLPAHLQWRIKITDHPFVLGLAPLLQLTTYLEPRPPEQRVVLDRTLLGREDLVRNDPALSPSYAGTQS